MNTALAWSPQTVTIPHPDGSTFTGLLDHETGTVEVPEQSCVRWAEEWAHERAELARALSVRRGGTSAAAYRVTVAP